MAKVYLWYYGEGSQPEGYHGGYATREQAISEGRGVYGSCVFSIVEAQKGRFYPPDADDLMGEWLDRWADDDMGAEDYPEWRGSKEQLKAAEADLDALLKDWAQRHAAVIPEPWCFADTRNEETFNLDKEGA